MGHILLRPPHFHFKMSLLDFCNIISKSSLYTAVGVNCALRVEVEDARNTKAKRARCLLCTVEMLHLYYNIVLRSDDGGNMIIHTYRDRSLHMSSLFAETRK